jgi:hypothetical protein
MPQVPLNSVECIAFVNNPISQRMLLTAIREEKIDPSKSVLFVLRALDKQSWWDDFAHVVIYPHKASLNIAGQAKFIPFYWTSAAKLRSALRSPNLRHLIIVNNDNILTNHALASTARRPECRVIVIGEGLMNYQDIQMANRAAWRNQLRPIISRVLGLRWQTPTGHLSGSFEPNVSAVYAFAKPGLFAPMEKSRIIPFDPVRPKVPGEPNTILFIETALWQWMKEEEFREFADHFVDWLKRLNPGQLLIKPHPNYPPSDYLRSLLPEYTVMTDREPVESMADRIAATRVVGFCCTGLITLSLLRPDIECFDFGHDFYLDRAYRGDKNLIELMKAVGVRMVSYDNGLE